MKDKIIVIVMADLVVTVVFYWSLGNVGCLEHSLVSHALTDSNINRRHVDTEFHLEQERKLPLSNQ